MSLAMDRSSEGHTRFLGTAPPNNPTLSSASSQYKFVTECFFITQRALHVGLIPAVNTFSKMVSDLGGQLSAEGGGGGGGAGRKDQLKKLYVVSVFVSVRMCGALCHVRISFMPCTTSPPSLLPSPAALSAGVVQLPHGP